MNVVQAAQVSRLHSKCIGQNNLEDVIGLRVKSLILVLYML